MTRFSRLSALALSATFLAGQPTLACDLACWIEAHGTADSPAGTTAMQARHEDPGVAMPCHGHQVRSQRVPPAALAVTASLPVTLATLPFPLETAPVAWRLAPPPAASVRRAVEPPPPRLG